MGQFDPECPTTSNIMANLNLLVVFTAVFATSYSASLPTYNLGQSGSGDIIEQARTQADTLKNTLRSLARKPEAAPILAKVFAGKNNCIQNMDQAIEAIEKSTKLFENAGTEIKLLVQTVQDFQNIKDTPKAVRQTAKIISILDNLIPKLTPSTSGCQGSSSDVFESMRSLGALVDELSSKDNLYYSPHRRQTLQDSAQILSKVTNFLAKESNFKFDNFCTKDKKNNKEFINAVGNMMSDLADLYTDLGGLTVATEVRIQEVFTKKVLAKIDKLVDLDLESLNCNTPGST